METINNKQSEQDERIIKTASCLVEGQSLNITLGDDHYKAEFNKIGSKEILRIWKQTGKKDDSLLGWNKSSILFEDIEDEDKIGGDF